jgi:hypothetical protein
MKPWIREVLLAVSLGLSGLMALPAHAAVPTAAQIQAVLAGGQLFLLNKLVPVPGDATKNYVAPPSEYPLAETAAAVAALCETGKYNNNPADAAYKAAIDKAVVYIMGFANPKATGGNGSIWQQTANYENGLALVALSLYGEQGGTVAGLNTAIDDAMSYAATGQSTTGGWDYSANTGTDNRTDMSVSQFAVMGLFYGSRYRHVTIDTGVANSWAAKYYNFLKNGVANYQAHAADGHFYYSGGGEGTPQSMTGAGLWSLAMVGQGNSADALLAESWFADDSKSHILTGTANENNGWTGHNYYAIYAMAKALAATVGKDNNLGTGTSARKWADDFSTGALATVGVPDLGYSCPSPGAGGASEKFWCDNYDLSPSYLPTMATSFMLQALAFANASTGTTNSYLPSDTTTPPLIPGLVTLSTTGGVTITAAVRGNALARGAKATSVKLPLDAFDFTLNHVTVGGTAVVTLSVPNDALDKTNANSFVNADGTLKSNIKWFKVSGGQWNGTTVPIEVDLVNKVIRVTLRDGGAEDQDHAANGTIVDPGAPGFDTAPAGIETYGGGGGCSMGLNGPTDPTLPLLLAAALAYMVRRRNA